LRYLRNFLKPVLSGDFKKQDLNLPINLPTKGAGMWQKKELCFFNFCIDILAHILGLKLFSKLY